MEPQKDPNFIEQDQEIEALESIYPVFKKFYLNIQLKISTTTTKKKKKGIFSIN